MKNTTVSPFSEERMKLILENLKEEEKQSGISRVQVVHEENSIFLSSQVQQLVIFDVEGMGEMSILNENIYDLDEAIVRFYYEITSYNEKIIPEKFREQLLIGIIKDKIHIGVQPSVSFEVEIKENENKHDLVIEIMYPERYCPSFIQLWSKLSWFQSKLTQIVSGIFLTLEKADFDSFFENGREYGISYRPIKEDDYYEPDYDDELNYRSNIFEEQGYADDNQDYYWGDDSEEPEIDENYIEEQAMAEYEEFLESFIEYVGVPITE